MQKILSKIEKIIDQIFEIEVNVLVWAGVFASIIGSRILIERIIIPSEDSAAAVLTDYLHNIFFFLIAYLIIWLFLSKILKIKPQKLAMLFLGVSWLVVLPPLFDIVKTNGGVFWSFYALDSLSGIWGEFKTFFGNLPSGIVYFGTKIVFILTIVLVFGLIQLRTKKLVKSFLGAFLTYATLFFMGTFPSWFAFIYYYFTQTGNFGDIQGFKIAQLFGAPAKIFGVYFGNLAFSFPYNLDLVYFAFFLLLLAGLFWVMNRQKFIAIIGNARFPQIIFHSGLFCIGLGLGYLAYPSNFNVTIFSFFATFDLLISVWLAWLASVIVNDIYDYEIDKISNTWRPLQKGVFEKKEYFELGILLFGLSILGGLVVDVKFALLLFFYQFLAWIYSARPFRLKKFPIIATFVSSMALLLVIFMGFILFSGDQNIVGLSWRIILLLVISLTLSLPIKDFKDIEGDRKYEIYTIPVIFGEERGRLIVATSIFISFMLSVFMLNEFRLFWWAMLFGGLAFWFVLSKKPHQLFWWVLGVIFVYGLILVKTLFL
ncbi:MAG: UbiA family prenyltransferase [Parcubacteria group bacterium]|jgi:4-hydroxybenzoate polyprenyltransferase